MTKDDWGYFTNRDVSGIGKGERYYYIVEGKRYPDPASAFQPQGVYGPSEVIDHDAFTWTDENGKGLAFDSLIFYELHVGTFTKEGTFDAIIPRLKNLADLGVNALQLMPVAAFSGKRNWGYDGAFLYAVQHEYGGPMGLKGLSMPVMRKASPFFWMSYTIISVVKATAWKLSDLIFRINIILPGVRPSTMTARGPMGFGNS